MFSLDIMGKKIHEGDNAALEGSTEKAICNPYTAIPILGGHQEKDLYNIKF